MIFVDLLTNWELCATGSSRYFADGRKFCHLTTDGQEEELHTFAQQLRLRLSWGIYNALDGQLHYELAKSQRRTALRLGARPLGTAMNEQNKIGGIIIE